MSEQEATRPWGRWWVTDVGLGYKTKVIVVDPGCRLSLQYHEHRSEHWVVVAGAIEAQIGDDVLTIREGQSAFVQTGQVHRMCNPFPVPAFVVEVQRGPICDEDDIVRLADDYGRDEALAS